jgi:hypothetical protein
MTAIRSGYRQGNGRRYPKYKNRQNETGDRRSHGSGIDRRHVAISYFEKLMGCFAAVIAHLITSVRFVILSGCKANLKRFKLAATIE